MTNLGLMSHCMGAFPQPLIMSDQVGEKTASKPTTVHFMLVVTAAAWVPQMHTFNLQLTHQPPLPNISYRCADV